MASLDSAETVRNSERTDFNEQQYICVPTPKQEKKGKADAFPEIPS
jgi:hypothetical protein